MLGLEEKERPYSLRSYEKSLGRDRKNILGQSGIW